MAADKESRAMYRAAAKVSAVGIEIAACLLIGFFGGGWLDGVFNTAPALSIFGFVVGLGAAIKVLYRIAKTTNLDEL